MNIKEIILLDGDSQYSALHYFNEKLAEGFHACGVDAKITNSYAVDNNGRLAGVSESTLVFAFNGMGINSSEEFQDAINKSNVLCWSFMVDHPYCHNSRILRPVKNQIMSVIDRRHLEYIEKYYPGIKNKFFVPHGGSSAEHTAIPFADKKYDIVFFGTYRSPENCMDRLKEYDDSLQNVFKRIAEDVLNGTEKTLEASVLKYFNAYQLLDSDSAVADIMPKLLWLDEYVRYTRRALMIRAALKSGYDVHVFGNGWENFGENMGKNLIVHENVDYEKSLDIMADSRIVLNNMPLFADGSHERIFSILASGSICLTDANPYLEENFIDKEDIFYYKWNDIAKLPELVKEILTGQFDVDRIIENGRKKAQEKHMWLNRAKEILDYCGQVELEPNHEGVKKDMSREQIIQILDMMRNVLDFIEKNGAAISIEEMQNIFENITQTFCSVNLELFQSRELISYRLSDIRDREGAYRDCSVVKAFFSKWIDFIYAILQKRNNLPNYVDEEFWTLMDYVQNVERERILLNAKKNLLQCPSDYVARINAYYHKFSYLWGDMDIFNDIWDVLEDRVNSLINHSGELEWLYDRLGDYRSKLVLTSMLYSWIRFDPIYISRMREANYRDYYDLDLLQCDENEVMVDLGAYTGDSAKDFIETYRNYKKIYCYEISKDTVVQMRENLRDYSNIEIINKGVGSKNVYMYINGSNTSDASGNMLGETGEQKIEVVTLDEDIREKITLIKMDIEGAEQEALKGSVRHIKEDRPKLLVCVYHNNQDIFEIPQWIHQVRDDYKFYLRSNGLQYGPSEIVLFAL